ncbi:hypothetical protein [Spongiactinospora sp. 9N601]|uniref:hypothetical protein n=1 Tax=Spongiactinospora sp. 9N601 TaxID=3375149 RepID=UPI0037A07521
MPDARTGQSCRAPDTLRVALPPIGGAWPVVLDVGWGVVRRGPGAVEVERSSGHFAPRRRVLRDEDGAVAAERDHAKTAIVTRGRC